MSFSFVAGFVSGMIVSVSGVIFLLSMKPKAKQQQLQPSQNQSPSQEMENSGMLDDQSKLIIKEALSSLESFDENAITPTQKRNDAETKSNVLAEFRALLKAASASVDGLDKLFTELNKEAREREKQLKTLSTFFNDLSKIYSLVFKELNKVSQNYVAPKISSTGSHVGNGEAVWAIWWGALSKTTQNMALDNESIAEMVSSDVATPIQRMLEAFAESVKKHLSAGIHLQNSLRDLQYVLDQRIKERDRCREKLDASLIGFTPPTSTTSSTLHQIAIQSGITLSASENYAKLASKLEASERTLLEALDRLSRFHADFLKQMPGVIKGVYDELFRTMQDSKILICKYAQAIQQMHGQSSIIGQVLTCEVRTAFTQLISDPAAFKSSTGLLGFEQGLVNTLKPMLDSNVSSNTIETSDLSARKGPSKKDDSSAERAGQQGLLNMHSEGISVLAACAATALPPLPSLFQQSIGVESCVWFNAITGRIYRDMRASPYFAYWTVVKATSILNKGTRPDYVDEFIVNDVQFGELPPVLLNVQWRPPLVVPFATPLTSSVSVEAKNEALVGDKPSESRASGSATTTTTSGGEQQYPAAEIKAGKNTKTHNSVPPEKGESSLQYTYTYNKTPFDVQFAAELVFRSSIHIRVSTKLWLNWPRDRYASIPVSLIVELNELSGRIGFGFDQTSAFLTFLEEPFTRIKIVTEVGEQFKLRDVPKLSQYMTKKLKEHIRKRFVFPNMHRLRLLWPRNWWPSGAEHEFIPTTLPILPFYHTLDPKVRDMLEITAKINEIQFGVTRDATMMTSTSTKRTSEGREKSEDHGKGRSISDTLRKSRRAAASVHDNGGGVNSMSSPESSGNRKDDAKNSTSIPDVRSKVFSKLWKPFSQKTKCADDLEQKWFSIMEIRAKGIEETRLTRLLAAKGSSVDIGESSRQRSSSDPLRGVQVSSSHLLGSRPSHDTLYVSRNFPVSAPSSARSDLVTRSITTDSEFVGVSKTALRSRTWSISDFRASHLDCVAMSVFTTSKINTNGSSVNDVKGALEAKRSSRAEPGAGHSTTDVTKQKSSVADSKLEWLSKAAREKYKKFASSGLTMDSLSDVLLGSEVSVSNSRSGSPATAPRTQSRPRAVPDAKTDNDLVGVDSGKAARNKGRPQSTAVKSDHAYASRDMDARESATRLSPRPKESLLDLGRKIFEGNSFLGGAPRTTQRRPSLHDKQGKDRQINAAAEFSIGGASAHDRRFSLKAVSEVQTSHADDTPTKVTLDYLMLGPPVPKGGAKSTHQTQIDDTYHRNGGDKGSSRVYRATNCQSPEDSWYEGQRHESTTEAGHCREGVVLSANSSLPVLTTAIEAKGATLLPEVYASLGGNSNSSGCDNSHAPSSRQVSKHMEHNPEKVGTFNQDRAYVAPKSSQEYMSAWSEEVSETSPRALSQTSQHSSPRGAGLMRQPSLREGERLHTYSRPTNEGHDEDVHAQYDSIFGDHENQSHKHVHHREVGTGVGGSGVVDSGSKSGQMSLDFVAKLKMKATDKGQSLLKAFEKARNAFNNDS